MTPLMGEYDKDDYAFDFETTFKRSLAAQKGNKIMMELMAQTTLAFECHCLPVNMLIMASERQKESISGRARQKLKLVHDFTSIIITSNSATRKCATWGKQDRTEREWEWEWQWGLDWGFEQDSAQDAGLCSTIVCAHRGANEIERQTTWKWAFPFNAFCSFFFSCSPLALFVLYCITFALPENIKNNAHRRPRLLLATLYPAQKMKTVLKKTHNCLAQIASYSRSWWRK